MRTYRVTQEFIAQQLNISRNSVSKVFNNQPGVSEQTREIVMMKAAELNYQFRLSDIENQDNREIKKVKDVAFVCQSDSLTGSFWTPIVKNTELILSRKNVNLRLVIIQKNDETTGSIPNSLISPPPSGIIMVGLFTDDYYRKVIELGYPLVALDISPDIAMNEMVCDVVLMEDYSSTYELTQRLIQNGHKNIVFAGDKSSCWSFYRRWQGYRQAMLDSGLEIPIKAQFDCAAENRHFNPEGFYEKLKVLPDKPTAFVCANDIIAKAVDSLSGPPYNLFNSISIAGFDNKEDLNITAADFSTVDVHLKDIGKTLGEQIIWRMNNPHRKYRFIEVESTPIHRNRQDLFPYR